MIGRTLCHYRIQEEISRGGMGVVYRPLDTKLDREVAVKVLPPELVGDRSRRGSFVQKAKPAAAIHHPHIATIHEIEEAWSPRSFRCSARWVLPTRRNDG